MKRQLIKLLQENSTGFVSGEELSQHLGISRVSIWKHIKKLQELNYDIQSGPTGYKLLGIPDALYPWEFGDREHLIQYFPEVDSTMLEAKQLARKGCPQFTVIVAERQMNGRGRLKRTWFSDVGGLFFTLVLRPEIPAVMMSRYSFAASLCLALVLQKEYGIEARVKWPNDILVEEKKICGMLAEMEMESDMVSFLNIGIGLNVNNNPTPNEPNSVSLRQLLGKPVSRKQILISFLDLLQKQLSQTDLNHIIPQWKQHTITLNKRVKVVTTTEEWEGIAVDIDETGALMLKQDNDSIKKVYFGDCFHQG